MSSSPSPSPPHTSPPIISLHNIYFSINFYIHSLNLNSIGASCKSPKNFSRFPIEGILEFLSLTIYKDS
ncbi:unnamed protein product [Musa acuminata subsp. malaccensis]|uniref:(wild Malaysian banana) hypothetical protein n=1 Tax=Musa acuminata subsp. malaccensis TaxID=214687 RepID=A0A8D6ZZJ3_MUSAM|nr:unnamed protein product [Musa acuminata subsp. malaccensis]